MFMGLREGILALEAELDIPPPKFGASLERRLRKIKGKVAALPVRSKLKQRRKAS